jgi:hypothetical protein
VAWAPADALPAPFVPATDEALRAYLAARAAGSPAHAGLTLRGWA